MHFDDRIDFVEQKDKLLLNIAKQYLLWRDSKPFDIGITCRKGLDVLNKLFEK